jgi:cytochrome P450
MSADLLIPEAVARDTISPAAYADGAALEAFKWLRANNPLGKAELEGVYPFWIVSKHADILEISRQNDLFHSGDMPTTFTTIAGDDYVRKVTGGSPHLLRTLVQMDAPDHPKYRVLTQPGSCRRTSATWKIASAPSPAPTSTGWRNWAGNATSSVMWR